MFPQWKSSIWALGNNCKEVANTITRGSFLDWTFIYVTEILEKMAKTNCPWGTRKIAMTKSTFAVSTNQKKAKINEEVLQELSWISTDVGLLMKQNQVQVNVVNHQSPRALIYDEPCSKEDTYFAKDHMGGFQTNDQGSNQEYWYQGQENQGQNYNRDNTYRDNNLGGYYDRNRGHD